MLGFEFNVAEWLEWQSFGLALFGAWVYGKTRIWGGIVGVITAASFMAFGFMSDVEAAIWSNIAFAIVHLNNIRVGIGERNVEPNTGK